MAVSPPYPELSELMAYIGEAGHRLAEIEASEGAAGNISLYFDWPVDPRRQFPIEEPILLQDAIAELAGSSLLVTGSGRRLREIGDDPEANLGFLRILEDGVSATLFTSPKRLFAKLTSELNSHLAVHRDQTREQATNFHALIHAQPLYITYLSHVPEYQDEVALNRRLLRWQPETLINLPEGIGFVPFLVPGSDELMAANVEKLRRHRVVVWAKHGVMARSDTSVKRACDRIEYAEIGARYEHLDLMSGSRGEGLTDDELRRVASAFGVEQRIF